MKNRIFSMRNLVRKFAFISLVVSVQCQPCLSQNFSMGTPYYTGDKVPGDAKLGKSKLELLFGLIKLYRIKHGGQYQTERGMIVNDIIMNPKYYGFDDRADAINGLSNPDAQYDDSFIVRQDPLRNGLPSILAKRPNGESIGSPKPVGTIDVMAQSSIYYHANGPSQLLKRRFSNPTGFVLILSDEGKVIQVPYDEVFYVYENFNVPRSVTLSLSFPRQAGVPFNCLTYEEVWAVLPPVVSPPRAVPIGYPIPESKKEPQPDNGGFESIIMLSRRLSKSVDRPDVWKALAPASTEFTLSQVQAGATTLGLETQVQKQPLLQLQKSGSSALLFLKDDGRIVTLTALDEDRAVVVDRGVTRNVERSVLEARYSGEALIPTKAVAQNAGIVATDAVRSVQLPSLEAEVPQQFVLRNTGTTPLTLQLEYPLLGVTESKLSKDTLAPGETATLDLKVKWRSILKAPTQNVLVSLQTSDPIVPRLQLAVLLVPPKTADAK